MTADLSEANWFKSSHSATHSDCVEVAFLDDGHVGVRDSKAPAGPMLVFQPDVWDTFTGILVAGDLRRQ